MTIDPRERDATAEMLRKFLDVKRKYRLDNGQMTAIMANTMRSFVETSIVDEEEFQEMKGILLLHITMEFSQILLAEDQHFDKKFMDLHSTMKTEKEN